jgi:predicted metal-dependent phosphoesterase TrpH
MAKLKVQLHCHTAQDPLDFVGHSEKELINRAAKLGYDVLAISCHNVVIFNEDLMEYARKKRILLIPAIEKSIERKHVLILNADVSAQNIKSFADLKHYRQKRPECFVIAVHPFYPSTYSLMDKFEKNRELFDAIEYSWFHSKKINRYNKKAVRTAEKYDLPVIATSDNHLLKYLDSTYSFVESEKNIASFFDAIRKKKIKIVSHDLKLRQMFFAYLEMGIRRLIKIMTPK